MAFKVHQMSNKIEKVIRILEETKLFLIGELDEVKHKIPYQAIYCAIAKWVL